MTNSNLKSTLRIALALCGAGLAQISTGCLYVSDAALDAPDAPDSIRAEVDEDMATLFWTEPYSGGHTITGYRAFAVEDSTKQCETAAGSCVITGLTAGGNYSFVVRARNRIGEGPASPPSPSVAISTNPPIASQWTAQVSGTTSSLNSVVWTGTQFVAVGASGTIRTSPDGVSWTSRTSGTTGTLTDVASGNNQLIALGYSSASVTTIFRSTNAGVTWVASTPPTNSGLRSAAWGGGTWVVVGNNGTVLTSLDGNTWTARSPGGYSSFRKVVWTGTQFVAIPYYSGESILTSPNGVTWTPRASQNRGYLVSLASHGDTLMALGYDYSTSRVFVMASNDGVSWDFRDTGTNDWGVTRILWAGRWVLVGSSGSILTSRDGFVWNLRRWPDTSFVDLYAIEWTGNRLIAVGESGTILTSP